MKDTFINLPKIVVLMNDTVVQHEQENGNESDNSSEFDESEFGVCFSRKNHDELLMNNFLMDVDNLALANDNDLLHIEEEISNSQNGSSVKGQKQGRKRLRRSESNHSDIFTTEIRQQ
ncbi:6650_t:CDS:2, partial [Racocetra fulgida]